MSVEGVSGDFEQNSGEIKVRYCEETMTIDNNDNENTSLVLMGYPAESEKSREELGNLSCKQIGESIDESALIFNDMRSVEEWLRNRPELDYDAVRNDYLCLNSDEISVSNEVERTVLPLVTSSSQVVEAGCLINWDDLVLDSDISILSDRPSSSVVPSPQNNSHYDQEFSESESTRCLSHNNYFQSATPPVRLIIDNNISPVSEPKQQANCVLPEDNVKSSPKPVCKKLPFVKIPKNCLMKGTILGKGDISLLSGKSSISFLNNTRTLNITNVDAVVANPNKLELMKKPSVLNRPTRTPTSLLKQSNKKSDKSISVLPVKSTNEISNNSHINKLHHSRSILKINSSNKNGNISKTLSENAGICEKQNVYTCKKSVPVALVAISTNKSDDTTEIVIKTEDGENVFKGKTSDILKATGSKIEFDDSQVSEKLKSPSDKQNYDDATINDLMMKLFGVTAEALEEFEGMATQTHLKCPIESCKYTSFKGIWMKVHVLQHYGIRPYKCDYPDCTWAFFTNFRLRRHQVIHYEKKVYCCPVVDCGRAFSTIYNVNSHLKLHNRPIAATCLINGCNQAFQTRRGYERHLQEHGIDYAPYVCMKEGCGKKYFTVNSLNSHSRSHQHNEEELRCSYCGKVFDQPCRLKAHINTHIGVKPYKCEFEGCMWAFTTSSKLRRHQRKHTQMRKHICKVCNKSFLRSEHLKDHSLKHFVKKSFICPISGCGTVFANKSSMYAHLKKHRNQEMKSNETTYFPCPMENCSIVFNTKESLRTHMQLSHVLTGLMNNENSQDTIQLLSDDNLITLEGLQGNAPNSGPGVVSFNSMSQEGLLVGMSDLVQCIPVMEQGDFSESNSSNNIITHVVFTDDLDDGKNQTLEEVTKLDDTEENIGSARTGIPYQAGVKDKQAVTLAEMAGETSGGLHSASDVVLSAGLLVGHDNLERGLLLQDELSGGDLYPSQEESGLLGAAGELQVLLLDPSTREQTSEFEQSTINLRDLE